MRAFFVFLSLAVSFSSFADDEDFIGEWTFSINAAGIAPYEGLLVIEQHDNELRAWVENGPAPVNVDGSKIEVTIDSRDRQGFKFYRG